jgi:hypothetical protein
VVAEAEASVSDDGAREVGIDQEVLAERLRGPDVVTGRELSDGRRAERRPPGVTRRW